MLILEGKFIIFLDIFFDIDGKLLIDEEDSLADITDFIYPILIDVAGQKYATSYPIVLAMDVNFIACLHRCEISYSLDGH